MSFMISVTFLESLTILIPFLLREFSQPACNLHPKKDFVGSHLSTYIKILSMGNFCNSRADSQSFLLSSCLSFHNFLYFSSVRSDNMDKSPSTVCPSHKYKTDRRSVLINIMYYLHFMIRGDL